MSEVETGNSQIMQRGDSEPELVPAPMSTTSPERKTTRPQDLIVQFWSYFAIIIFVVLAVLVLASLVAPSHYARQRFQTQTTTIPDREYNIEVLHPVKLFLGRQPSELRISVWPKTLAVPTASLVLRFAFGEGVIVTGTQPTSNDRVALVTFHRTTEPQVSSLYLSSAGSALSRATFSSACIQTGQQCTGFDCNPVSSQPECNTSVLYLSLETPRQAAWRNFLTNSVSEKAPTLLIVALLTPIFSQVIILYQRRSKQEYRRRTSEARSLANNVKHHLVNVNAQAARMALQAITEQGLSQWLPVQDREWLEWLIEVANSGLDSSEPNLLSTLSNILNQIQIEWPDESAGALICAMEKTKRKDGVKEDIRKLLGKFSLDRVTNPTLRDQYCRQWNKLQEIPLQYLHQTNIPNPDKPTNSPRYDQESRANKTIPRTLLPHGRAEWEETTLFGGQRLHFWASHPAYGKIAHAPYNLFVHGQPGCGRTALALALYYDRSDSIDRIRVYIPLGIATDVGWSTIQRHWAKVLLNYTCDKATRLFLLGEGQRLLLARVLVQALSYPYVVAHLPHILDESSKEKIPDKSKTSDEEKRSEEERHLLQQQVKRTQYELLAQAVRETAKLSPLSKHEWYDSALSCCKALGFSGIHLLLDYPVGATVLEQMVNELDVWQDYGVVSTFFMPTTTFQTINNGLAQDTTHELTWNENQLNSLLEYLLQKLIGPKRQIGRLLEDKAREALVNSVKPSTPRQMVYLWRKILQEVKVGAEQITLEDVRRAKYL